MDDLDYRAYSTPGGIVDLTEAVPVAAGVIEVADGLTVEHGPTDPAALAVRLAGALGLDPRKGVRR